MIETKATKNIDMETLKQRAAGRWPELLSTLGNISADVLDGKHHPCPRCGGTDRFRLIDVEAGALLCNQCFKEKNGDGIAALMWLRGWDFQRTMDELSQYIDGDSTTAESSGTFTIADEYDYVDENGTLLYQVVRLDPKDFRQRRPRDGGGWEWNVKGVQLVPYRLPELLAADPSRDVLIVEGEKDADRAANMGIVATTCAMGAGKWRPKYNEHFRDRNVVVVADNDLPGREHAHEVARSLFSLVRSVKVVELPDVPEKGDLSDWFDQGGTMEEFDKLIKDAREWSPALGGKSMKQKKKSGTPIDTAKSHATALVKMAEDQGGELWHTPDGTGFITLPIEGHAENWSIKSASFKRWLQREFYSASKSTVNAQAIQDAIGVFEGKAVFEGRQYDAHLRVAEHQDSILIDLADAEWKVVNIDAQGWRVLPASPVKFRRCRAMLPLPEPAPGSMAELQKLLGLCNESWPLVVGWILAALRPTGPFPILNLNAEQGAGKTTAARKIRALIDPNTAPMRCEPKEPRNLMIAANNGWVIALDNLSYIHPWLSDSLCRLSTGGGFSTRELYSDNEEVIYDAQRPIIITGIEELATRGDLLDRSLMVMLPNIPESQRRPESAIWHEFNEARPRLLGALYDAVSMALRDLPTTTVARLPRMADFALWATAAEPAIGLKPGEFMARYAGNRAAGHELALESSPVGKAVLDFVGRVGTWTGTASELLAELDDLADERTRKMKGWPQTARVLSGTLKRLAPNLRAIGVEVESGRTKKGRFVTVSKLAESSVTNVTNVTSMENQGEFEPQGDAAVTQSPEAVTQKDVEDDAGDAGDDEIPASFGETQSDLSAERDASVCSHDDVEEIPTFDGYINRQCRQCGEELPCRKGESPAKGPTPESVSTCDPASKAALPEAESRPVQGCLQGLAEVATIGVAVCETAPAITESSGVLT
ncbi:MAG: hypothetical protein JW888_02495 [Pirellulales bacterium]|nr:hypothetical protein [Pirellulales bacterium]